MFLLLIRCANSVLESQNIGYAQKSGVDKLQLPSKPKKPSPPFFQFLQEKRPEVKEKHNLNSKGINETCISKTRFSSIRIVFK